MKKLGKKYYNCKSTVEIFRSCSCNGCSCGGCVCGGGPFINVNHTVDSGVYSSNQSGDSVVASGV